MRNACKVRLGIALGMAAIAGLPATLLAQPVTTAWTYQGKLMDAGLPAAGPIDVRYRLFDGLLPGAAQIGSDLFATNVALNEGAFSTQLDFGPTAFNGSRRWLEIAVRPAGGGTYQTLSPRQEVVASPYSMFALNVATGATPWQFSGANATFVGAGDVGAGTASPTAKLHIVGVDSGTGQALNANNKLYVTGGFVGVNRAVGVGSEEAFGVQAPATGSNYGGMYVRTDSATGRPFYGYANTGSAIRAWTSMNGADGSWSVNTGNADRMTLSSTGFLGLGTNLPAAPVDLVLSDKRLQFRLDGGLVPGINLSGTGGNLGVLRLRNGLEVWPNDAATSPGFISIRNAAASPTISLDGGTGNSWLSGTLGVGTGTPTSRLHLFGSEQNMLSVDGNNANGVWADFNNRAASGRRWTLVSSGAGNSEGAGKMLVRDSTAGAVRMTFDTDGDVGIGTSSPAQRLDVRSSGGTDFTVNPGSLFGAANASAVTLDTTGVGTIGVWDNFAVNNNLAVSGATTLSSASVTGNLAVTGSSTLASVNSPLGVFNAVNLQTLLVQTTAQLSGSLSVAGGTAFGSTAAFNSGGAPFTVANSTKVSGLNADLLDGLDSSQFLSSVPNPLALSGSAAVGIIAGTNSSAAAGAAGVRGTSTAVTGTPSGVFGSAVAPAGVGVRGTNSAGGVALLGVSSAAAGTGRGVSGEASSTDALSAGVVGTANGGYGVWATSNTGVGLQAESASNFPLYAVRSSNGNRGWIGGSGEAFWAEALSGNGIVALCNGASNAAIYCRNNATGGLALNCDGEAQVKVLTILGGSDLAEPFDVADAPKGDKEAGAFAVPGMLVVIDAANAGKLVVSSEAYDTKVAGIISGANGLAPGLTLRAVDQQHADGDHAVAMTGRVWCYVDANYGAITPGDRLTSSPTPGHAMKASDNARAPGAVVGKAMTSLAAGEKGLVLVLVNLQ